MLSELAETAAYIKESEKIAKECNYGIVYVFDRHPVGWDRGIERNLLIIYTQDADDTEKTINGFGKDTAAFTDMDGNDTVNTNVPSVLKEGITK